MEKKFKVMVTFGVLVFLVAGLYFFTEWFSLVTGYFKGEDEVVKLTRCLNEKGAEFYGAEFCADCEKQMKIFGRSAQSLKYIDCGKDKEFCPNLKEIPAIYLNKEIHYNFKSFDELKQISGC